MDISVRSHHVDITEPLRQYAEEKLLKLDQFHDQILSVNVNLKIEPASDINEQQVVEVNLNVPGQTLRATETHKDMYAGIDLVLDKLSKQLLKLKGKQAAHSQAGEKAAKLQPTKEVNHYIPKPMTPEDALEHVGTKSFLMFRNSDTMEINVIYPLANEDGFGLIEP